MSSSLPTWLERLLGFETGSGEGTAWTLEHTWRWPPWMTVLLVAFAAAFVIGSYMRENREARAGYRMALAGLRLAAIGLVLFMLAQYVLSLQRTGLPYVAVLVDDSLSSSIVDRYGAAESAAIADRVRSAGFDRPSRWNLARTLLCESDAARLRSIADDYKLRLYYSTGTRPSQAAGVEGIVAELNATEPSGESTRLGTAIRAVLDDLRGSPPAALIVLSDGINTDGPTLADAASYARRKGVPLYLVGLGDDKPVCDLRLSDLLVDETVFVDDIVYFEAKLASSGYEGKQVRVVLREKDKPAVLGTQTVTLGADGQSQQVRIAYRPTREGEFRYVVEVEPREGELQTENNRQERAVRVRKQKIRVLLAWAEPSFEFRYLQNMLHRDETVELKTVLQEADLEHAEQDPTALKTFPIQREELFQYDVIILGDVNPAGLTAAMLQNLAEFVDQPGKGGALVCVAGPKYMPAAFRQTPLAGLMPVDLGTARAPDPNQPVTEGFVVQPTELGLAMPGMHLGDTPAETVEAWKNLAPVYWLLEAPDVKRGARVLAEHPSRTGRDGRRLPVILLHYAGSGKVLFHATDETWRWRWRVGDVYFARYWIQTIRYLARSKLHEGDRAASLSADRREYRRGEPVRLRVRFADEGRAPAEDDGVTVVLENKGSKTERIPLRRASTGGRGVFETVVSSLAAGTYHAWLAIPAVDGRAPATDFTITAPPGEFERVEMDARELQRAAEMTRGRYYTFATAEPLVDELPEGRQVPIEALPPKPLWNTWPILMLLLTLLIAEWLFRKLGGMA